MHAAIVKDLEVFFACFALVHAGESTMSNKNLIWLGFSKRQESKKKNKEKKFRSHGRSLPHASQG
jgi:hypothetical protein